MEEKLKKLFDFQRFDKNEKLEKLIQETENRYAAELSDDDLSLVNAAGEAEITGKSNIGDLNGFASVGGSGGLGERSANPIGSGGGGGGGGAGGGSGAAMSN